MRRGKLWDRRRRARERGATIVVVALSFLALLGMGALTVDLGQLLTMRADAQRVADAAALAGASAYRDFTNPGIARQAAQDRAFEYAVSNYVGNQKVDTNEVAVSFPPAGDQVRVGIRRMAVGGIFTRVFDRANSRDTVFVGATATAGVIDATGSGCVMPFAMPDAWNESLAEDPNQNHLQDSAEVWTYNPGAGDSYAPFSRNPPAPNQTGYGSNLRDSQNDYGRQLTLQQPAPGVPNGPDRMTLWHFRSDSAGSPDPGERAADCDPRSVELGNSTDYEALDESEAAAVGRSLARRIRGDRNANWDASTQRIEGSNQADWRNSPRVVKVALYSPDQLTAMAAGRSVTFNNIALFFLEPAPPGAPGTSVAGRFLYYAGGEGGGPGAGSLVRTIRLVE